jgi:hypothetical protein
MSRRLLLSFIGAALALSVVAGPVAAGNPSGSGQPNTSCQTPGFIMPPGFLTGGFANAGAVYAGSGASLVSGNPMAVSQYDVACYQVTLNH